MNVSSLSFRDFAKRANSGRLVIQCGPVATRVRANLKILLRDIYDVYRDYPVLDLETDGADFSVHMRPVSLLRKYIRPSHQALGDKPGPFAPLPSDVAFVGYEMSQNWQIAMTQNRHMLFHAATIASADGRTVLMPGLSGSGKSTLGAAMGFRDWRFLGDEFGLFCVEDQAFHALPRPISLKNQSIDVMKAWVPDGGFSRSFLETPKGTMAYLRPPEGTLSHSAPPAKLSMVVFPKFTADCEPRFVRMRTSEAAIELINACVNFDRLGTPAFEQLMTWAETIPVFRIQYSSLDAAQKLVEELHSSVGEGA